MSAWRFEEHLARRNGFRLRSSVSATVGRRRRTGLAAVKAAAGRAGIGAAVIVVGATWTLVAAAEPAESLRVEQEELIVSQCLGCHGAAGVSPGPIPSVYQYYFLDKGRFVAVMQAYRTGRLPNTVMGRIVRGYSEEEVEAMYEPLKALAQEGIESGRAGTQGLRAEQILALRGVSHAPAATMAGLAAAPVRLDSLPPMQGSYRRLPDGSFLLFPADRSFNVR